MGNSNDATDFPHKILLTDTQVSRIGEAFSKGSLYKISKSPIV